VRNRVHQTLQSRLIRLTMAAVLFAMIATMISVAVFEITTFRPRALDNAKAQANLVASIIVPALEFDDARTAEKMLHVLQHERAVEAAGVYRVDGSRLAHYQRTPRSDPAPASSPTRLDRFEGRKIFTSVGVLSDGAELGRVWLQAELPDWPSRVRQYGFLLVLVALAVVVLSLFISVAARRQITNPLHVLAETVQQVGQNRDLQLRVAETGTGEIGDLARSFNAMLETLAERQRYQREREVRLAAQNQGLLDMARTQKEVPEDSFAQSQRLTEILCAALSLERAGIWLFTPDRSGLQCRDLYERGAKRHHAGTCLPASRYPDYFAALEKERVIEAADARNDPRTREFNEDYSIPFGIGALLDVPVRWRGRIAGVLCLEHVGGPRAWQLDEVGFALSAADRVTLYLEAEASHLAAAALRDSEERYRSFIEEANDAIFTLSNEGKILELNQAVEKITGWKREAWLGRNFTDPLLPDDRLKAKAFFAEVVRGGRPPSFEFQIRSRSGSMVTMEFAVSPQFRNSEVVGLLGIGRDVTERKQAGEVQAQLEEQLRQSQKMEAVGNLAGGIAHDFNNILTAIIGNAQLAEMEMNKDHPSFPFLLQTLVASHRAKELVNQILTFSRRQEQKREPLHLVAIVQESLKLLRPVLPTSIEIRSTLPPGLPSVLADATQIQQVVINLATNAAHAMETEGGRLEFILDQVSVDLEMVKQRPQLYPGRFIRLWVTDTGTGMDEVTLQRIFEPFFTTKETGKGTGLGLAVVHGIMQQHEGAIVVYSVPGKGTTFQLYFPVDTTQAAPPPAGPVATLRPARPGTGQSILLVDDEDLVLAVGENILRRAGYQIMPFNNPALALAAFLDTPQKFDLVITDLTMPGIKGTKLASDIQTVRPGMPVILATGFGGGLDTHSYKGEGLFGPLQKPFTSESLLAAVSEALASKK
jgi:PAS domain S-box-containing protein